MESKVKKISFFFMGLAACFGVVTIIVLKSGNTETTTNKIKDVQGEVLGVVFTSEVDKSIRYESIKEEFAGRYSEFNNKIDKQVKNNVLLFCGNSIMPVIEEDINEELAENNNNANHIAGNERRSEVVNKVVPEAVVENTVEPQVDGVQNKNDENVSEAPKEEPEQQSTADKNRIPKVDDGAAVFVNDNAVPDDKKEDLKKNLEDFKDAGGEVVHQ